MYRRNSFKDWWDDIGFICAIVIVFMALIFLVRYIEHVPSETTERTAQSQAARADRH